MNISPNTKIVICQDVPLDNSYEHTIHFGYAREYEHMADQYNYFYSKRKYVFEPTTYQRVNSNTLRIQMIADNLYNCNYLMFQNTNFRTENKHYSGDKWFYAFITSVNYINNAVTEITYEIDVMQTWMFDYVISTAYVERQHSSTDGIGDNLVPETIVPTCYVTYAEETWPLTPQLGDPERYNQKAMILATEQPTEGGTHMRQVTSVDGIPCRCWCQIFDMVSQRDELEAMLTAYRGQEDKIVGIFGVPPVFNFVPVGSANNYVTYLSSYQYNVDNIYGGDFDGYVPKNNKMYTYPYNKMRVQNSFGQYKEYKFELFKYEPGGNISFVTKANAVPKPSMITFPAYYANNEYNVEDALSIGEYPQGVYTGDSFQMWLHQGFIQDLASVATAGVSATLIPAKTDRVGQNIGARNLFSTTHNAIAHAMQALMAADPMYGNLDSKATYFGLTGGYSFKFKTERPVYSQAKMVDDFFSRFGYAQNKIMTVDTYTRTHWTYTKTLDCTIKGSVPADDMRKICDIFNEGITWWVHPEEIGNYNFDNEPRY